MLSLNIIFHVGAAVALICLLLAILRLRRELQTYRFLLRSLQPGASGVYVDWPASFLGRLARLCQCEASGLTSLAKAKRAVRIKAGVWMAFANDYGLRGIRCEGGDKGTLLLQVVKMPSDVPTVASAIEAAMDIGYTVSIQEYEPRATGV